MSLLSFAKNTGYVFLSQVFSIILSAIASVLLIRYLAPGQLGIYTYIITIIAIIGLFSDLGQSSYFIKEISQNRENANLILGTHIVIQSLITIGSYLVIFIIYSMKQDVLKKELILICSVSVLFLNLKLPFASALNALHDFRYIVIGSLISGVATISLTWFGIHNNYGLHFFISITVFANFINILIAYLNCAIYTRPSFNIDWTVIKKNLLAGIPYFLTVSSGILYNRMDILMLENIATDYHVGLYSAATKILYFIGIIPIALQSTLYPKLSQYQKEQNHKIENIVYILSKYMTIVSCCFAVPIFFCSDNIVLIFSSSYLGSVDCLQILIWSFIPYCMQIVAFNYFMSEEKLNIVMYINCLGVLLNFVLNLFLISRYGSFGAATATLVTHTIVCSCFIYSIRKIYSSVFAYRDLFKLLSAMIIAFGAGFLFGDIIGSFVFILMFGEFILLLNLITPDEKVTFRFFFMSCKEKLPI